MYRGQSGMWSWLLHRVTGIGILLFLLIHIVDITLLGFGPDVYNAALAVFANPVIRIVSLGLIFAVLYHAFNGLRIVAIDFWPQGTKYQAQMMWAVVVLTVLSFLGMAYYVVEPMLTGCKSLCG